MKALRVWLALLMVVLPVMAYGQTAIMKGTNSTGGSTTNPAILTNSSGNLVVSTIPSGTYMTLTLSGAIAISAGSTTTVVSGAADVTALTIWNVSNASVTVNVMDGSGNYILPPNFVIPAGQAVGYPVGSGLLYSGIGASASVANAAKISAGYYQ